MIISVDVLNILHKRLTCRHCCCVATLNFKIIVNWFFALRVATPHCCHTTTLCSVKFSHWYCDLLLFHSKLYCTKTLHFDIDIIIIFTFTEKCGKTAIDVLVFQNITMSFDWIIGTYLLALYVCLFVCLFYVSPLTLAILNRKRWRLHIWYAYSNNLLMPLQMASKVNDLMTLTSC